MSEQSTKRSKEQLKEIITVWIGVIFLIGLVGAGWFPRRCPILRQALSSCPAAPIVSNAPVTDDEKDIARVPHQAVSNGLASFAVPAQINKSEVIVNFSYRGDLANQSAYFSMRMQEGTKRLALITHPLLANLTWPRLGLTEPELSLYQRDGTFTDLESFKSALAGNLRVAADPIAAEMLSLPSARYVSLDSLTSLDSVDYVLTTYLPPTPDGGWSRFHHTFDLSKAVESPAKELEGSVQLTENQPGSTPFLISTVHLDYRFPK